MKSSTTEALVFGGAIVGTVLLTALLSKRAIRRKCRAQVMSECMDVPVFTEGFCTTQTDAICDI